MQALRLIFRRLASEQMPTKSSIRSLNESRQQFLSPRSITFKTVLHMTLSCNRAIIGRPPGKLGTEGHFVTERALVAYIADVAARRLRSEGLSVLVVSADKYPHPLPPAKVFLAISRRGQRKSMSCESQSRVQFKRIPARNACGRMGLVISTGLPIFRFCKRQLHSQRTGLLHVQCGEGGSIDGSAGSWRADVRRSRETYDQFVRTNR